MSDAPSGDVVAVLVLAVVGVSCSDDTPAVEGVLSCPIEAGRWR
jgi:hypothetical protein